MFAPEATTVNDYSTNEPTMEGAAAAILLWVP